MNTFLTNLWTFVLLAGAVVVLVATVRMARRDRAALPPGSPRDWRDDALRWDRLQIR